MLLLTSLSVACNSDKEVDYGPVPTITLNSEDGFYTVKVGDELTITPSVAAGELYAWIIDGTPVSNSLSYTFKAVEVGTFYLTFRALNNAGESEVNITIEVLPKNPPTVQFVVDDTGVMTLAKGRNYTIMPEVINGEDATYAWTIDGKQAGSTPALACKFDAVGSHDISLTVSNEDGSSAARLSVEVVARLEGKIHMPAQRYISQGRTIYLRPVLENFSSPSYEWSVDGVQQSAEALYAFTPAAQGDYALTLSVRDSDGFVATHNFTVTCCAQEGSYRREPSSSSINKWTKVYEYMPAPGQFINEDKSGFENVTTTEQAIAYAEKRLSGGNYLSLGGWGGYVVVGFDHSIANTGEAELSIMGNMFDGSSEAGIVWVMQDTNGNGQPDDEWYELKGSEWGTDKHSQYRTITYTRAMSAGMGVQWRDGEDNMGRLARNSTHTQDHYYPKWIKSLSATYCGSMLKADVTVDAAGKYINNAYGWGYADNLGSDAETTTSGNNGGVKCHFKISNAVNADGSAASLQYIDFVKVQTAVSYTDSPLGEISTEILNIFDESK